MFLRRGKMNKDLDERLVPKGQYRDAMNINVVSSEGSNVGSVTNVKGNTKVVTATITSPTVVGKIVDTENDKIILFLSGSTYASNDNNSGIDTIIEYDPSTGITIPIITDVYKGRPASATLSGEFLKFNDDNFITGINILNGILFWTDNVGEPKKVNIENAKSGLVDYITITANSNIATGGDSNKFSITASNLGFGFTRIPFGTGTSDLLDHDYLKLRVTKASDGSIVSPAFVHVYNSGAWDQIYFPTGSGGADLVSNGDEITITLLSQENKANQHTHVMVNNVNKGLFVEKNITVIRPYPLNAPSITMFDTDRTQDVTGVSCQTPADTVSSGGGFISSTATPQNHTFWTFKDASGQVKVKPPGTGVYGNTGNIVDQNDKIVRIDYLKIGSGATSIAHGDVIKLEADAFSSGERLVIKVQIYGAWNESMYPAGLNTTGLTSTHFDCAILEISENMTDDANSDRVIDWSASLVQPDGMYLDQFVRFAYRWKYADNEYSAISPFTETAFLPTEGSYKFDAEEANNATMQNSLRRILFQNFDNPSVDVVELDLLFKYSNSTNLYVYDTVKMDQYWGNFIDSTKESTKSLLEETQLLRHYDNVPKKALAQEVVGGRIVYANYFQQYDTNEDIKFNFNTTSTPILPNNPKQSIKSMRDYQLGVVYLDKQGRQTPILTNSKGAITKLDQRNSSNTNKFEATITSNHPDFATHYKYYIKESSGEYFNLSLDRYYRAESFVENTVWLSFASSDVNKVQVDDYIILKKEHGTSSPVKNTDGSSTKYKVLAKESTAPPNVIKRKRHYGTIATQFGYSPGQQQGFPTRDANFVEIGASDIFETALDDIHTMGTQGDQAKYIRITSLSGFASKYYEVESVIAIDGNLPNSNPLDGEVRRSGDGDHYRINLKKPFGKDMDFTGTSASKNPGLNLEYYTSDTDQYDAEFAGRFFIKIAVDKTLEDKVLHFNSGEQKYLIQDTAAFKRIENDQALVDSGVGDAAKTSVKADFTPENANGPYQRNQSWAIDDACAANGDVVVVGGNQSVSVARQGRGFQAGNNFCDFRFFGSFMPSRDTDRYPLSQSDFFPNTFNIYNQLRRIGTKFSFGSDPTNTVYEIIDVTISTLDNYDNALVPNNGTAPFNDAVRFSITLDQPIAHGVQANEQIICANNPNADNPSAGVDFRLIEDYVGEQTFYTETPAVFELEPKEKIDLNIYHESAETILIPKVGMKIYSTSNHFNTTTISGVGQNGLEITIAAATDGTIIPAGTIVTIEENHTNIDNNGDTRNYKQNFKIATEIAASSTSLFLEKDTIRWYNCISFGNGVESNRIKDDFNAPFIDNGPKVSTVLDEPYQEEHKKSGLIYSGIFNTQSSFNQSNQFVTAEKITKDLNPSYGSIQKLYTRNTNLLAFCEDRVLKILANKDALFNADGKPQLLATNRVLGQSIPFAGEYGISKNPESFAKYGNRYYYSDKNRGAILRLSGDGVTNIAEKGMTSYFKEKLPGATRVIGCYDKDSDLYNVTMKFVNTSLNSTVSFTEKTNGWTSFKSFILDCGMSLNGKYYTCSNGELYQHSSDSGNSNTFYGTFTESKIKFVFNDEPSTIKQFKTIGYEGSESRLYNENVGSETSLETNDFLTEIDGKGWYVNSIETNEGSGNMPEFVEKEGKWSNNIKGISTTEINIDTKESSIQGLSFPGLFTSGNLPVSVNNMIVSNISCIGGTGSFGVVFIGPTNMTWWWNSKWSFVLVKSENNGVFTEPGFLNDKYEYGSTTNNGLNNIKIESPVGLNRSIRYTFDELREGYYKIFAKEYYSGLVLSSSVQHIASVQPLVANGVVHTHASVNSDDAVIRVTPSLGSGNYTNAKISVNADMSSPTTDTSLAGTAPSQFFEFSSLASGTYYFTAQDANNSCGATTTSIQSLIVERALPVTLRVTTNNGAVCNILDPFSSVGTNLSKNASTLTLTSSGGSGQYQYSVSSDPSVFNFGSTSNSTTFTTTVPTPSVGHFLSVRDAQDQVASLVTVRFDQPDCTTKIGHSVVVTNASNQAGNNGSAAFTVTGANQSCVVVIKKCDNGSCTSQTTVATLTLSENGGEFTGTATGLTGVSANVFTNPITTPTVYTYEVTDGSGCRADAPIGSTFPTGHGAGVFLLGNTFNPVSSLLKVYYKVYDLEINSDHLLGFSGGLYPTQSSANFWITPIAGNPFTHFFTPGPNPNALWRNAYVFRDLLPELQAYNVDVTLFKIESQGNNVIDAADFRVVIAGGIGQLNGDGEHTSPAISNPGAIENASGLTSPAITFTNSQTLNGTVADQNNYITVVVPLNFTMPASQQKVLFHILGTSYINSLIG